ncbi:MAG: NAD(+)/NADH kinase [Sedimentisphaerales bacterium]|nr:NAD(+)/NADH kinase [Sedimentisphaerales bacterium]
MARFYYIIVNPKSGSNINIGEMGRLCDYLRAQGNMVQIEMTRSLLHAGELAELACRAGADVIVVAGGDGTVRTVFEAMVGRDIPVLIVPCGTENLLACELGLDGSFESSIKTLEHGIIRHLDMGLANNRYFMAIAGIGFDGEVIRRVHSRRSGHITPADYVWPICRTFWEYKIPHLHVEADGELVCDEPGLAFVSNISRYAIGLGITPEADMGDGLLDLCIYKCRRRLRLLAHSLLTVLKTSHISKKVLRLQCREIVIKSPVADTPVQLDGDPGPDLPLKIEINPSAVQVLTPPPIGGERYHAPVKFYHVRRWILK